MKHLILNQYASVTSRCNGARFGIGTEKVLIASGARLSVKCRRWSDQFHQGDQVPAI